VDAGHAVLLIEHNLNVTRAVMAERGFVLFLD
jgi:excinuclease UvrABC ATPase subunit